jgi:hypothetical protein
MPVLPVLPTHKCCSVNNLGWHPQHGMEEVIGSIPIRSTKQTHRNPSVLTHSSQRWNHAFRLLRDGNGWVHQLNSPVGQQVASPGSVTASL